MTYTQNLTFIRTIKTAVSCNRKDISRKVLPTNQYFKSAQSKYYSMNTLQQPLTQCDPEVANLIKCERDRQKACINLIASENFTSLAVMDALGSHMQNKYSEGYPGARYYAGNEFIDQAELLCQKRALDLFELSPEEWGVNVQSYSGSPANLQAYQAIMRPHDRLMGLDLPHGGHLSHGYQTDSKKISAISTYFETMPYRVNPETGLIDYDQLEANAKLFRPKVLVAGVSAYCRLVDYGRMREIADSVKAYLLVDMAHTSGLIAGKAIPSPFKYADIVTTTTHKSLRGPRGAMIFFRKGERSQSTSEKPVLYDLEEKINFSVFPGHQGGPHNHTITALAVALGQANRPEFKEYAQNILENAKTVEDEFRKRGYSLVSDGTDSHMVLIDVRSKGIDGARAERALEVVNIITNKNTTPTDVSAMSPSGIRIGTPAMTTRGFMRAEFVKTVEFIDETLSLVAEIQKSLPKPNNKLKHFKDALGDGSGHEGLQRIKQSVAEFANSFFLPAEK